MRKRCKKHHFFYTTRFCPWCMDEKYFHNHAEQIMHDTMDNTHNALGVPEGKGFIHYFDSPFGEVTLVKGEEEEA
jgi:hypothetical protein